MLAMITYSTVSSEYMLLSNIHGKGPSANCPPSADGVLVCLACALHAQRLRRNGL